MSMPNIPNITPIISLDRCETINLLLSSIALEEISLSHILNAEGEKLQHFLKTCPKHLGDYLEINESVNKTLRTVVKSQLLLELKLEEVAELDKKADCGKHDCPEHSKYRKKHPKNECVKKCHHCGKENCMNCSKKTCPHCGKHNCHGCEKNSRLH